MSKNLVLARIVYAPVCDAAVGPAELAVPELAPAGAVGDFPAMSLLKRLLMKCFLVWKPSELKHIGHYCHLQPATIT